MHRRKYLIKMASTFRSRTHTHTRVHGRNGISSLTGTRNGSKMNWQHFECNNMHCIALCETDGARVQRNVGLMSMVACVRAAASHPKCPNKPKRELADSLTPSEFSATAISKSLNLAIESFNRIYLLPKIFHLCERESSSGTSI